MRIVSLAAAACLLAAPAWAQDPETAPVAAESEDISINVSAEDETMELYGDAFEGAMEAMGAQIEAVQADTTLSEEEKAARVDAVITVYRPVINAFAETVAEKVEAELLAEGSSAEEAAMVAEMVRTSIGGEFYADLMAMDFGAAAEGEADEDAETAAAIAAAAAADAAAAAAEAAEAEE